MPKKTTILIILLAVTTGVLVFFAITSQSQKEPQEGTATIPESKAVDKTARTFFNPPNIDVSETPPGGIYTVDLLVDTGGVGITGVQAELQFDPSALTNVSLSPTVEVNSFFGGTANVPLNEINLETGRISYIITIGPDQASKKGIGKIATLSFQKAFNPPSTTTINFLNKTLVTKLGANESILKETTPLNIILSNQTTTAPFIPPTTIPAQ